MFSYNTPLQKHHFLDVLNAVMLPLVAVKIEQNKSAQIDQ